MLRQGVGNPYVHEHHERHLEMPRKRGTMDVLQICDRHASWSADRSRNRCRNRMHLAYSFKRIWMVSWCRMSRPTTVFGVKELIEFVTKGTTIERGTVLITGTPSELESLDHLRYSETQRHDEGHNIKSCFYWGPCCLRHLYGSYTFYEYGLFVCLNYINNGEIFTTITTKNNLTLPLESTQPCRVRFVPASLYPPKSLIGVHARVLVLWRARFIIHAANVIITISTECILNRPQNSPSFKLRIYLMKYKNCTTKNCQLNCKIGLIAIMTCVQSSVQSLTSEFDFTSAWYNRLKIATACIGTNVSTASAMSQQRITLYLYQTRSNLSTTNLAHRPVYNSIFRTVFSEKRWLFSSSFSFRVSISSIPTTMVVLLNGCVFLSTNVLNRIDEM